MQHACGAAAETARATGTRMPTSVKVSSSLAVRRCIWSLLWSRIPLPLTQVYSRENGRFSGLAMNFGPPPTHADEQETPVVKELRLFALEGMADELEGPSGEKERKCVAPQPMNKDAGEQQSQRKEN